MIRLSNIDKYYYKNKSNELHIINDLNLTFDDTGLTTILGPSGSGKSTLLHVIGGLDKAKGTIQYDDASFDNICTNKMDIYRNQHIGYIFQNYHLLPTLTVYQNLKIQLELIGITDEEEVNRRIDLCLKMIGMDKYKRRNVTALSGGQQQRVAIARALVKGAKVIIADEPTGNLDSKNSIEVMNILKLLSKKCLIVLVTHDQRLASHYSDRIIKIEDGKLIADIKNVQNDVGLSYMKDTIYLDQYEKDLLSSDTHKVTIYKNTDDKLELNIVVENNTIYLENKTDLVVKVLGEETNIVFEEHKPNDEFKEIEFNDELEFENNVKLTFKQKMKNFADLIKKTFLSFVFVNKKVGFMYASFFMIGILFCFCISSINYCTAVDGDILKYYPTNAIFVDAKNSASESKYGYLFEYSEVKELFETQDAIIGVVDKIETSSFTYKYMANRSVTYLPDMNCYAITEAIYGQELKLKGNEVAISRCLADEIIDYFTPFGIDSYEKLISSDIFGDFTNVYRGDIVIKEIIDYPSYAVLFSDEIYYTIYNTFYQGIAYRYLLEGEELPNLTPRDTETILPKIYISRNLESYISTITYTYEVAGYFDSEDFEFVYASKEEFNSMVSVNLDAAAINVMPYYNGDFNLVEGKLPDELNEIIIPDVFKDTYALDSTLEIKEYKYKVVGYFASVYPVNTKYFYSNTETAIMRRLRTNFDNYAKIHDYIELYTNDSETLIEHFNSIGHPSYLIETYALQNEETSRLEEYYIALVISITITLVMIIFMFFMSRSKMMNNIYNIGVYRALGASRKRIYINYLLDAIYLATFTVLAGFILMLLFVNFASSYLPGLAIPITTVLIVIPAIYFFVILSSLLPIYLLLRKTPIEILAKYDI